MATDGAQPEQSSRTEAGALDDVLRAAVDGDDSAFAQLVRSHKERVLRLVARFARNSHDLDEIAQDVFVDVHRNLASFRGDAPFEHWICRIATRRCQDYLRRIYRRRWWTSLNAMQEGGFDPESNERQPDPRVELLRLAMRRLKPEEQTVLTLLEIQEHTVRETAAFTGWSEANVKVRAFRARQSLRREMDKLAARRV